MTPDPTGIVATDHPHAPPACIDWSARISSRSRAVVSSGIRRIFDLAAGMKDPINLSIGQPDFPVPRPMKDAAIAAIEQDRNGYTPTQGLPELREAVRQRIADRVGWDARDPAIGTMITSGTSGGLLLACLAVAEEGGEIIAPDPYFVMYPQIGPLTGASMVFCDTYPDFRMTAERIEPLLSPRTRAVILNSPSNPCGVVLTEPEVREVAELCRRRGVLLISDEIYDEFVYGDALEHGVCPSPARTSEDLVLIGGFGKTYACTGWRMGFAAGPKVLIEEMCKLQQHSYICAPTPAQHGVLASFGLSMREQVDAYRARRDLVLDRLGPHAQIARPGGAFYAFVEVPPRLGMTASEFVERAIAQRVLVIPGCVFSHRDTHFRLSYAASPQRLAEGLGILAELLAG
jgi:aspartate/methionine/tyrosine aminotransferase